MADLAEVFARYGPAYLEKYGPALLPSHRRAMRDVVRCRTEEMGGQVYCCNRCGHRHYVYHSCRNRSCPQCHHEQAQVWLEQRRREFLNVRYFHVVFTVPDGLHACMRSRQVQLYDVLMRAAGRSLIELAADPHYVGGLVGVLAVLHTWGRTLTYHPHVHCLVTGGGLNRETQEWRGSRDNYLVPVKALSQIFRRVFRELLGPTLPTLNIPAAVWRSPWVVHCEPVHGNIDRVLGYLGRYVHRIAISNERFLSADDGYVRFRYQDTRDEQWKVMSLPAEEFIRRYLQHVLPQGFHKVRYFGLWAPGYRKLLHRLQLLLGTPDQTMPAEGEKSSGTPQTNDGTVTVQVNGQTCPHCGHGTLIWAGRLPRRGREPP